jgi:hypothetical protein
VEIGPRQYKDKSSECWIVLPSFTLSVYVWTLFDDTYLITEPILLHEPDELLKNGFQSEFKIKSIYDIDSTLLEQNKAIELFNQSVHFNSNYLFGISSVEIEGKTINNDTVKVKTATRFDGFEIWKIDDFQTYETEIENILKERSFSFTTTHDIKNQIIKIELNR